MPAFIFLNSISKEQRWASLSTWSRLRVRDSCGCVPFVWWLLLIRTLCPSSLQPTDCWPLLRLCAALSCFSRVQLFATPWTTTRQAPLFMGFSQQQYWSGVPCPPPEDLPNPGIKSSTLASPALQVNSFTTEPPGKPLLDALVKSSSSVT